MIPGHALTPPETRTDGLMKPLIVPIIALTLLGAAATATAEAPPRYRIELVLFEHLDANAVRAEHWPETLALPDYEGAVELGRGSRGAGFAASPDSSRELGESARLLEASERYAVVAHLIWEQPGLPDETAVPLALRAGKDYGPEFPELMQPRLEFDDQGDLIEIPAPESLRAIEGTIRVVLGRYLHIHTDLIFRKPVSVMDYSEAADMYVPVDRLRAIPVKERRRMRSRELHYVDHPMLGMLVKITPIEAPAAAPRAGGAS